MSLAGYRLQGQPQQKIRPEHLDRAASFFWGRRRTCRSGWVWCVADVVDTLQP